MKKIIIFFILLNLLFTVNALNKYEPELVGIIKTGSNEYEIGYDPKGLPGEGPLTARLFTISHDNIIYIYDKNHRAIKVFNKDLAFIKSIPVKKQRILSMYHLKISKANEYYIYGGSSFKKLNKNGELVYEISHYNLPDAIEGGDFYLYKNWVFSYDRIYGLNYIDETGKINKEEETKELLIKIKEDKAKDDNKLITLINDYKYKDKIAILEGDVLTSFEYLFDFYKYSQKKNKKQINIPDDYYAYIGKDNDNNTYWECRLNIYVFNKYGELLDSFEELNRNHKAVSPDGDLWYWDVQPEGVYFYKVTRRWWLPEQAIGTHETVHKHSDLIQPLLKALQYLGFKQNDR